MSVTEIERSNGNMDSSMLTYTALPKEMKSFEQLGYIGYHSVKEGIVRITQTGAPAQLASSKSLDTVLSNINTICDVKNILTDVKSGKDVKTNLGTMKERLHNLHEYTVAFSNLLRIYQSVSYAAYESAYQLHLAELNYAKRLN